MAKCPFCDVEGRSGLVLKETPTVLVLANLFPAVDGHLLVVPRGHFGSLAELPPDIASEMFKEAVEAACTLERMGHPAGINIFLNVGRIAGQSLEHLHLHVVPRNEDDGLENFKRKDPSRERVPESTVALLKIAFS